ncbi:MAG TPA: heavy-metal-associated domain-containing protein [Lacipirellulaceae bacterium]|nr:heavy-metal-associated domain-containing protein [Lacipirellulaceae bacterium]
MTRFIAIAGIVILAVGCSQTNQQTGDISKSTTPVSFNTAGAPTVVFNAPDMMCPEGCGAKVKEILSGQPGAKEVVVNFDAKTATVAFDKDAKFDSSAAVAALVDHGFKNSSVKSDAPTDGQPGPSPAGNSEQAKTGSAG